MDQSWVPGSLRLTLRDVLEVALARPFRPYYSDVAEAVIHAAKSHGSRTIVELGAGTAPLTQHLAPRQDLPDGLGLVVCDLNPDLGNYDLLARRYPGRVRAIREPVDFSKQLPFSEDSLLVLSATFHHIPLELRAPVLRQLAHYPAIIAEPVSRTALSMLFACMTIFPALLLPPILLGKKPGSLRRFFWCWLLPVAPLLIVWDGIVSSMRCWDELEWKKALATEVNQNHDSLIEVNWLSQSISW